MFSSLNRDVSCKNKKWKFDSLTSRTTKVTNVAMQTMKIQPTKWQMRLASSSYVEQTDILSLFLSLPRVFKGKSGRRAHKVILGCEKFALDGTSLPVSYEVSPFREHG